MKKKHKTLMMSLKFAEVDEKIAPVVKWLNSFQSVNTMFSCEGIEKDSRLKPYVLFSCLDYADLVRVSIKIGNSAEQRLEIVPPVGIRSITYRLSFSNNFVFDSFLKNLPKRFKCKKNKKKK